jgi:hypothetical protein
VIPLFLLLCWLELTHWLRTCEGAIISQVILWTCFVVKWAFWSWYLQTSDRYEQWVDRHYYYWTFLFASSVRRRCGPRSCHIALLNRTNDGALTIVHVLRICFAFGASQAWGNSRASRRVSLCRAVAYHGTETAWRPAGHDLQRAFMDDSSGSGFK